MYTPLFVIALHISYKHAAWAFPGAGARPLIWKTVVCSFLTAWCDAFGKVRGQGDLWVGREALSMEWISWFLQLAAGGSCTGGKMDPLFCSIPSSRHISPRGWCWRWWHKAPSTGGTWQLAPMLIALRYPRHEGSSTTQPLQIPGAYATGAQKHQCVWIVPFQAILIQAIELLKTGAACFLGAGQGAPKSSWYDAAFFLPVWGTEAKGRATFLALFLDILERRKSNHGPWLVIFSWKQHKPELPASLIKLRIYRGPFIYIHLKCSLPGNWLWTEIIIWKDLTLRTVHSVLNAASVLHPFHRIPAWCVHHRGDSSRFYMCLLVGL